MRTIFGDTYASTTIDLKARRIKKRIKISRELKITKQKIIYTNVTEDLFANP